MLRLCRPEHASAIPIFQPSHENMILPHFPQPGPAACHHTLVSYPVNNYGTQNKITVSAESPLKVRKFFGIEVVRVTALGVRIKPWAGGLIVT